MIAWSKWRGFFGVGGGILFVPTLVALGEEPRAAYDRVHAHALGMADALSAGLLAQFPQRFR